MIDGIYSISFFAESPQNVLTTCRQGLDNREGLVFHALIIAHSAAKVNPSQPLSQLAQGPGR